MDEPSKVANRILLSTGFGLILVCGFAIIEGRMVLSKLGPGHLFLIAGLAIVVMSRLLNYETSKLAKLFPNESQEELTKRIDNELNQIERESRVGNAWAELESKVLISEIGGESE